MLGKIFHISRLNEGVKMAEGLKEKMAFTCYQGLFQYRRMPFGLTNTSMAILFASKEWNFVFVYLDDLLIRSRSIAEHVEQPRKVFLRLE